MEIEYQNEIDMDPKFAMVDDDLAAPVSCAGSRSDGNSSARFDRKRLMTSSSLSLWSQASSMSFFESMAHTVTAPRAIALTRPRELKQLRDDIPLLKRNIYSA